MGPDVVGEGAGGPVPRAGRPGLNQRDHQWLPDEATPPRTADPAARPPAGHATATHRAPAGMDDDPGYVIHLPVRVASADSAVRLARTVAGALDFLPELDPGETTVSTVDDQNNRRRVFCDLLLPDRSRCPQRYAHRGPCGPIE